MRTVAFHFSSTLDSWDVEALFWTKADATGRTCSSRRITSWHASKVNVNYITLSRWLSTLLKGIIYSEKQEESWICLWCRHVPSSRNLAAAVNGNTHLFKPPHPACTGICRLCNEGFQWLLLIHHQGICIDPNNESMLSCCYCSAKHQHLRVYNQLVHACLVWQFAGITLAILWSHGCATVCIVICRDLLEESEHSGIKVTVTILT